MHKKPLFYQEYDDSWHIKVAIKFSVTFLFHTHTNVVNSIDILVK